MSPTTYDLRAARAAARTAAEMRLGEIESRLAEEYEVACALADDYAAHLAVDGNPWEYSQPERHGAINNGLARVAREAVFNVWNEGRERKSLTYPWGGLGQASYRWRVHELLLDRLGEPVTFAELAALVQWGKASPKDVAQAVWLLQVQSHGAVRVRKTKVGGKAAYLAREPRAGDDQLVDDAFLKRPNPTAGVYREFPPFDFPEEVV